MHEPSLYCSFVQCENNLSTNVMNIFFLTEVTPLAFDKQIVVENPCEKCMFPKSACIVNENGQAECHCPQVCTADYAPVCGTDGRNYTNKCELEVEACKPENLHTLRIQHVGACGKNSSEH